jgi:pyrroloquinoline quinone biosynthesis protein B
MFTLLGLACSTPFDQRIEVKKKSQLVTSLIILGNVQDGGAPHIGCQKDCCRELWEHPDETLKVVSLGVVDNKNQKSYLFEATPDITEQMKLLKQWAGFGEETPDGIFLTHAHIGHYTGLMYLGREALGGNSIPVYAMPKMKTFLEDNGPWSQLVINNNIAIQAMANQQEVALTSNLKIVPFTVPHRDEYSETVGYKIIGPNKTALFIPDIDKWHKWEVSIIEEIAKVDYAFLDGSFYDAAEINHRDISEIPHPFTTESMELFKDLPETAKDKIHFIHFNHTNPALDPNSEVSKEIIANGFHVARMGDVFGL